jgi:hypothetical protein
MIKELFIRYLVFLKEICKEIKISLLVKFKFRKKIRISIIFKNQIYKVKLKVKLNMKIKNLNKKFRTNLVSNRIKEKIFLFKNLSKNNRLIRDLSPFRLNKM